MARRRRPSPSGENEIQHLHRCAVDGDEQARSRLMLWVYSEAKRYYSAKVVELGNLTAYEAQELASQFLLNFVTSWRGVRQITNYTRSGLRQNLFRYLSSRRVDTVSIDDLDAKSLRTITADLPTEPWMSWSDEAFDLYTAVLLEYYDNSDDTVQLVETRLEHPELPYAAICGELGISEGAARMRVSRFFERVRRRLENCTSDEPSSLEGSPD